MYFEDLTPYRYGVYYGRDRTFPIHEVLNVGWLQNGFDYQIGDVDQKIVLKLKHLLAKYQNATIRHKGFHYCDLCSYNENNIPSINSGEKAMRLGSRILWLPSSTSPNKFYACPDLIVHYIVAHNYRPPDEFLDAVDQAEIDPTWNVHAYEQALIERYRERIRHEEQED